MAENAPDHDTAAQASLLDGVRDLLDDGQLALRAELEFQKARLAFSGKAGVRLAILAVVAVLFAHGAVLALTAGLLFALATVINPWAATAIVTGFYLTVVGLCAFLALRKWGQIRAAFSSPDTSRDTP